MRFLIFGAVSNAETTATGAGMRELSTLPKRYGPGRWRKRECEAELKLPDGAVGITWIRRSRLSRLRCRSL
jgi:hypothetical protein